LKQCGQNNRNQSNRALFSANQCRSLIKNRLFSKSRNKSPNR